MRKKTIKPAAPGINDALFLASERLFAALLDELGRRQAQINEEFSELKEIEGRLGEWRNAQKPFLERARDIFKRLERNQAKRKKS